MTEKEFWAQQRRALLMHVKGLEQQRDAVLQQIATIERMYNIEKKPQQVTCTPSDSFAGIMQVNEGSNA